MEMEQVFQASKPRKTWRTAGRAIQRKRYNQLCYLCKEQAGRAFLFFEELPMLCAIGTVICGSALLSPCLLLSQQAPKNAEHPTVATAKAAEAGKVADKKPKLTDDQKLALQLLETSEAASRGFEAPMRSYGLLQTGASLTGLDPARARSLLGDAFRASLEIQDDDYTKVRVQEEILRTLLPLSQEDVEGILPQAEMKVRKPITDIIVGRYAEKKQFDKALELVNQIAAIDEFPYGSATRLMDAMLPEMAAEKQTLFTQAVASYRDHEHAKIVIGPDTLTGMIIHVAPSM